MRGGTSGPVGPPRRYFFDEFLAQQLGVSRRTLARWREGRELGFIRLPGGQKVVYLLRHILAFEAKGNQQPKRPRGRPPKLAAMLPLAGVLQSIMETVF